MPPRVLEVSGQDASYRSRRCSLAVRMCSAPCALQAVIGEYSNHVNECLQYFLTMSTLVIRWRSTAGATEVTAISAQHRTSSPDPIIMADVIVPATGTADLPIVDFSLPHDEVKSLSVPLSLCTVKCPLDTCSIHATDTDMQSGVVTQTACTAVEIGQVAPGVGVPFSHVLSHPIHCTRPGQDPTTPPIC